jgi:TrmH family RNA methyltransferase
MISKAEIAFIKNLKDKKERLREGLFICEGTKMVAELLKSNFVIKSIYHTSAWRDNEVFTSKKKIETKEISESDLDKISALTTPNEVLALVQIPAKKLDIKNLDNQLALVLDTLQDPGNLGTIIRVADWFGIANIVCSSSSVDLYNTKVVQATMGSIFRVNVFYEDLHSFFTSYKKELNQPVYGTFIGGASLYEEALQQKGLIVMGNESKGISKEFTDHISHKISIPSFSSSANSGEAESLNVAIATAIVCSEFKRRV